MSSNQRKTDESLNMALNRARRARDPPQSQANPPPRREKSNPSTHRPRQQGSKKASKTTRKDNSDKPRTTVPRASARPAPPAPPSKKTQRGVQAMVQGVLSSKKKEAKTTTTTKKKKKRKNSSKHSDSDSDSSFIDLKGDIKIRMAPFLVDEDGKYPGEPPSPSDEASRERKLQRQRRYEALRREFSAEDAPPAPSSKLQNPPSEPLPPNTLQQQQRQQQQQLQSSSDSLYGDLDWDAEEAELNKQAEATKREMAKLQR